MHYLHLKKIIANLDVFAPNIEVTIKNAFLRELVIAALRATTKVDEKFYLSKYRDVARAVAAGTSQSASDHFYETGYFENRLPRRYQVDEDFYLTENPDVAKALREGKLRSCQDHFEVAGYAEGRNPFPGFKLF